MNYRKFVLTFLGMVLLITVGVGGLYYNNVRQYDMSGIETGRRDRSGLSLKLNLADIQVGIVAHLWKSKK